VNEAGGRLPAPRRYGDREVARILKRATELQRAEPSAANPEGLTLAELAEIAREAGIDPALLRRAATEVDLGGGRATVWRRLAGAPVALRLEHSVEGEIPTERFDALIPIIQQATEGQGTASAVGRTLTWSSQTADNMTSQQILVTSADGRTLVRWEERFGGLAGALFGGILGGGGVGLGAGGAAAIAGSAGPVALAIAIPLVLVGGSYALSRGIFTHVVKRREANARQVIAEIASYVERFEALPDATPAKLPEGKRGPAEE
jgi:hypothetical protein